jgi:hypothetical protein
MTLPNNAYDFHKFMLEVWRMDAHPQGDGTVLTGSPLYDRWHNAIHTARYCGAGRTGGTIVDGLHFHVYRFPADHGAVSVRISPDGDAISIANWRYASKR